MRLIVSDFMVNWKLEDIHRAEKLGKGENINKAERLGTAERRN